MMDNLLGLQYATDLREVIGDIPAEVTIGTQTIRVTPSRISLEVETQEGGTKTVPGVDLVGVLADFETAPAPGIKVTYNDQILRVLTVETDAVGKTARLRCAYLDA